MGALHSAPWCVCAILAALAYFGTLGTGAPEPASAASERGSASRTARACHAAQVAARERARRRKAVRNRARCARIARTRRRARTKPLVAPPVTGPTEVWRPYAV